MTVIHKLKENPLWTLFWNTKNIIFSLIIVFSNFLAALFEGVSFGCILLALSSLNASVFNISAYPFLKKTLHFLFSMHFSQNFFFITFVIVAIVLQAFRSGVSYFSQYVTSRLSLKLQMKAQLKVYQQILEFSFPCVSKYKVGDLVKYAETPSIVMPPLLESFNQVLLSACMITISIGMMFFLNVPLTLFALVLFCLFFLFQKVIIQKIGALSKNLSKQIAGFFKHAVQNLSGIRLIHTFQRQENVFQKTLKNLKEIVNSSQKINLWHNSIPAINEMTGIFFNWDFTSHRFLFTFQQ